MSNTKSRLIYVVNSSIQHCVGEIEAEFIFDTIYLLEQSHALNQYFLLLKTFNHCLNFYKNLTDIFYKIKKKIAILQH